MRFPRRRTKTVTPLNGQFTLRTVGAFFAIAFDRAPLRLTRRAEGRGRGVQGPGAEAAVGIVRDLQGSGWEQVRAGVVNVERTEERPRGVWPRGREGGAEVDGPLMNGFDRSRRAQALGVSRRLT